MGFLSRLRTKKQPSAGRPQALAMVLLSDRTAPDPRVVVASLRELWPDAPPILDLDTKDSASVASIPGGSLGMLHVPMPVPASDLEGPIRVAWHWPEAQDVVLRHESHVICFASSTKLDHVDLKLFHTKFVAAVASSAAAVGVYVGDAMLVRKADEYTAEAREASRSSLPLLLWVGFNPVGSDRGRSAYTTGLTFFQLLELEVRDTQVPWSPLLAQLADIAHYEITAGLQIGNGETIGSSTEERIPVMHAPSAFIPATTVAVVGL